VYICVQFKEKKVANMALIGYAEADFHSLITRGHYYVDRTSFIAEQERLGNRNLLFARPRRFGKSLWISTLHHYYDIRFKDEFETLFGNLYIGKNPTPNRNNYIVLRFQFSGIDVSSDERAYNGFRNNVKTGVQQCMGSYPNYFSDEDMVEVDTLDSPESMIQILFKWHKLRNIPHKIYILIDEYDHFANELFSLDIERFQNIVSRTGFVRKFYELIKNAMGEGVVERNFMTGVAPLTVDALTSGFNTVTPLTLRVDFHKLMGFTEQEVQSIMQAVGVSESNMPKVMSDLTQWYNGYLFHHKATERLYNSDMVMYFAEQYERYQSYPDRMLDINIASDYTKVRKVFIINSDESTYVPLLKTITQEGVVSAMLTDIFNFEKLFEEADTVSLLFYMGWLTIKDTEEGFYRFQIPNYVIRELYYDYFVALSEQETNLNRSHGQIGKSLFELSKNNNPRPFLDIIKSLIDKQLSLRDAQKFDEKHLKMLLIPYLSLSATHYVVSEPEWENQYADIVLLKRPNVETKYNFILELKYIKKADKNKIDPQTGEKNIDKITREARQQLDNYLKTDNAKRIPNLKAWLLILVGREWYLIEEVPVI
jgi:Predicted AAA-ATPase/PD-(D/E)XK nuclease superfamily